MRAARYFLKTYPWQSVLMLGSLLLAAAAEGVGLSTLVPVLGLAFQQAGTPSLAPTGFEATVLASLRRVGIEPTLGSLVAVVTVALWLKGALVLLSKRQVGYTVAWAATDLRLNLLRALLASRWAYYTRQPIGAAAGAMSTEADRASLAFHHLALIASYAVQTLLYTTLALAVSWQATAFAALAGLLTLLVLSFLVRISGRAGRQQTLSLRSLLSRLTDVLQGVKLLKAMDRERLVAPILEQDTRRLHKALRKRIFTEEAVVALQEPIIGTLLLIGLVVWVTHAQVAIQSAFVLLFLCFKTLDNLNKAQRKYQLMIAEESALVSLVERTQHAQAERESSSGTRTPTLTQSLCLDAVSVGHARQGGADGRLDRDSRDRDHRHPGRVGRGQDDDRRPAHGADPSRRGLGTTGRCRARRHRPAALAGDDRLRAAGALPAARQRAHQREPRRPRALRSGRGLGAARRRSPRVREAPCPRAWTARSASAACCSPAASASASRSRAPSCAGRGCWFSTRRRRPSTRPTSRRSGRRWRGSARTRRWSRSRTSRRWSSSRTACTGSRTGRCTARRRFDDGYARLR